MTKLTYYKNLDGVRAVAALMVMTLHFFQGIKIDTPLLKTLFRLSYLGQTGVDLFFVLSGFLITRILLNSKNEQNYFRNFYTRRTLRIFPLYYLFLAIYYFISPWIFNNERISFADQIYYWIYLQNFAMTFGWSSLGPTHFWTLSIEEHFYLFWPVVIFYFSNRNVLRIIVLIIVGAILLRIVMLASSYNVGWFTLTNFDSLAIGALLSLLELKGYFKKENASFFKILTVTIFIPTFFLWMLYTTEANFAMQVIKNTLLSFFFFALIGSILSMNQNHSVNRFLQSTFLTHSGKISYGLYVYHLLAFRLVGFFLNSKFWELNMIIEFSLTYLLATLSYYLYEVKFLNLKKYVV